MNTQKIYDFNKRDIMNNLCQHFDNNNDCDIEKQSYIIEHMKHDEQIDLLYELLLNDKKYRQSMTQLNDVICNAKRYNLIHIKHLKNVMIHDIDDNDYYDNDCRDLYETFEYHINKINEIRRRMLCVIEFICVYHDTKYTKRVDKNSNEFIELKM